MSTDKAENKEDAAPKAAKSNVILIVIIAVLGTLLVGGGVTAVLLMKSGGHAAENSAESSADEAEQTDKKEDKKKEGKKDGKKGEAKAPAIYVALDPAFVVNFDSTQVARFLQVTVEIMTRDAATAALLKENNALVRNDLLLLFGGQNAAIIQTREGKETLRKETLAAVKSLTKAEGGSPDLVEAVYFTTFVMQ
jgi:flagellar protein FliL